MAKEILKHELLFDDNRLFLPEKIYSGDRPIIGFTYTTGDILNIREAYNKYIVDGGDIEEAGEYYYVNPKNVNEGDIVVIDNRGRTAKKFPPTDLQIHYYEKAKVLFDYLQFLRNYKPEVGLKPEKRTLKDIALQYQWMNKPITNQNKDEVAATFPELKLRNGKKLYNEYLEYNSKTNRIGIADMSNPERENRNHLKIMETALKFLSDEKHIKTAESEILEFKTNVKKGGGKII